MRADLAGLHRVRATLAGGKRIEYHYAWRGGPLIWKTGAPNPPGSPGYHAAWTDAARPAAHARGTFREIIIAYQNSREWRDLSPRTQADYRVWIDRIDAKFGTAPIAAFNRPGIRPVALNWRDQWHGKQADYAWTVLRRIVHWAYDRTLLTEIHIKRGGGSYRSDRAEIIWTRDEIAATCHAASPEVAAAITMAEWTALGPAELAALSHWHVKPTPSGRRIEIHRHKTGQLLATPITPAIAAIIDAAPKSRPTILRTPRDRAWSPQHLSKEVKRFARAAGVRDCLRMYDLRGTACTRLLSIGCSLAEIALAMGWSVENAAKMIHKYAALDPAITDSVLARIENGTVK